VLEYIAVIKFQVMAKHFAGESFSQAKGLLFSLTKKYFNGSNFIIWHYIWQTKKMKRPVTLKIKIILEYSLE